jgi:hypothetical protein
VRVMMVTGVRNNDQPGDLERRRGSIRDSTPFLTHGSSCRTPTWGMIPGTRSGPVTSAQAQEPVDPAEARQPDEPAEAWEPAAPFVSCEPVEPAEVWKEACRAS